MSDASLNISRRTLLIAAAGAVAMPYVVRSAGPARAAAPMLGVARPTHYRFKIGACEVTTIFDGARAVDGPHPIFGNDQPAEEVQKYAEARLLPTDKMEIMFTPVIVNTGNELVAFDAGLGAAARPGGGRYAATLAAAGYSPDQIDIVVLTHYHPDHIGGLMEDGKPLFPNARYVTHETEFAFWTHPDRMSGKTEKNAQLVQANVKPFAEKATFIKDGTDVATGIRAVDTHGHTPGHVSYHLESEGKRLVIGGDFCNHYVLSLEKPEWHVSFDTDKDMAVASRKKMLDMIAADRIPFTSYHMPFPAVGYVEKTDTAFRYVPASYQPFI